MHLLEMLCFLSARKSKCLFLVLLLSVSLSNVSAQNEKWVSGFWVGWQSAEYPPAAIDFSALTHVIVFSLKPRIDGSLDTALDLDTDSGPRLAKEIAARAHAAGRKALLCVGGEASAGRFAPVSRPRKLRSFVKALLRIVDEWGFDGIDIDWEPIEPADYELALGLLAELRAQRPGMTLTADIGFFNAYSRMENRETEFYGRLAGMVDQLNVMTYGMADGPSAGWTGWVSWHSSALYGEGEDHPSSVSSSVDRLLDMGIPSSKIGIGIGFYGIGWNSPVSAPLQQPHASRVVSGDNDLGYRQIMLSYYSDSAYRFDTLARVPYLSFARPKGDSRLTYISYEDRRSIEEKGAYVKQKDLGGVIIWHLNEGYMPQAGDPHELLHAVHASIMN